MFYRMVVVALCVCGFLSCNSYGYGKEAGMDVFIKACQNQGLNNALIRTGFADIEIKEYRRLDIAAERLRYKQMIESQKKIFKDDPETLNNIVTSLEKTRDSVKEEEVNYFRYKILFKGNDPGTGLHRVVLEKRDASGTWNPSSIMIMRGDIQKKNSTVMADAHLREFRVSFSNYFVLHFQMYGRIQDTFSKMATLSMLDTKNLDKFIFLPYKVEEFKKNMDQLSRQTGISILQISGKTPYDAGAGSAIILESKNVKGIVYLRYWIDPSRGYVCPLVQEYNPENGKILQEYTAGNYFLHAKSGLWYPALYEEKTWDQEGNLIESRLHKINPATFQFNQPLSDQEFYINVPEGVTVVDERDNLPPMTPLPTYRAIDKGSLSLAENGLSLSEMSWLERLEIPEEYQIQKESTAFVWFRLSLIGTGLILMLVAFYRMWKKGRNTPHTVMLMLLLPMSMLAGTGCSKNPDAGAVDSLIFAAPSVLDFGKVRPTDPPVEVSFDVCNNSNEDVSVTEVLSGCGCTVVDVPTESIPPGGKVSIATRINVLGRPGIFENMLLVKTTMEQNLFVQISGNVEADVWANEQSIRCTVAPKERQASTDLVLHTVKYPNITFADHPQEKGVTINEISRETKDGKTSIRFLVTLDVDDDESEMIAKTLSIVPKDDSIAGLTIPLYCYREGEEQFGKALTTSQISLGLIQSGKATDCRVYGDPDILIAVKEVDLRNVSDAIQRNVKTSFRFDKIDGKEESDSFLTVTLIPDGAMAGSFIEGKLILKTQGNREYAVDLRAEIQ